MTTRKRPQTDSPIPSITLQITQKTADHFLQTSAALKSDLQRIIEKRARIEHGDATVENSVSPLLEDIYEAMLSSQEEPVLNFVQRVKGASVRENEQKVAALLFHDSEMNEKLGQCLTAIRSRKMEKQTKEDFVSLFRGILTGIMCCCEPEKSEFVVEGKPERTEGPPPPKRTKSEDATESTKPVTEESGEKDIRDCQSPSFDSSLATLHDEDNADGVKKEIAEVANYAADQLLTFFEDTPPEKITGEKLIEWYSKSGKMVVPWMELLSLQKWESASSGPVAAATEATAVPQSTTQPTERKEPDVCNKENEANETSDFPLERPRSSSDAQNGALSENENDTKIPETKAAEEKMPPPPPPVDEKQRDTHKKHEATVPRVKSEDDSPGSLLDEDSTSRTLVSFDFSGSGHPAPLCINISEDNLYALRHFVHRTGLMHCPAPEICKRLLRLATRRVFGDEALLTLQRDSWLNSIDRLLGKEAWDQLSNAERAAFTTCLADIFACYEGNKSFLRSDEVDLQEFSVGFCFFCAGNKSSKLATGFEMLDDKRKSSLSQEELLRYLNSYLSMLVAMSLLKPITQRNIPTKLSDEKRRKLRQAVESGSRWTLSHFVKHLGDNDFEARKDSYSFEKFASWYSGGGYEVAPWLELLDLSKVFSLLGSSTAAAEPHRAPHAAYAHRRRDRVSSLRRHHNNRRGPPPEILFTFPLAHQSSLVVLRDDAHYVQSVVQELGLLSMNPDDLWASLSSKVEQQRKARTMPGGAVYVGMATFVEAMQSICPMSRAHSSAFRSEASTTELLSNFFQCFDLEANDHVALDELMGGLTLLCGGKKSHKLAFAFGVFDTRPGIQEKKRKEGITHSLSGEDLFLFLRSILIVTFSCCRQSLDMTDGMVARCIADTANMICNDVMRHQWEHRHKDRLNFDEFGQWYNDGGYERAPWLELLDLKKWVLVDDHEEGPKRPNQSQAAPPVHRGVDHRVPPPPPEDSLDADFFENNIMPMDSMDEMDMILMQPSHDKDGDLSSPRIKGSFSFSSVQASPREPPSAPDRASSHPLKFHLNTDEEHGGYILSLSHTRIRHLRRILENSLLHKLESEVVCNKIIAKASKSKNPKLTRDAFDGAVSSILSKANEDFVSDPVLVDLLHGIFTSFDREKTGKTSAMEIACGFTVLCHGKKSDKLEFAFEVLDKRKKGHLSKSDMTNYLRSFLTVLLSIAFSPVLDSDDRADSLTTLKGRDCDASPATLTKAADAGAKWAASMAFHSLRNSDEEPSMSFDEFAEWYTSSGYSSIPWLELLDLRKWVFADA